jgi:hypothetical protein
MMAKLLEKIIRVKEPQTGSSGGERRVRVVLGDPETEVSVSADVLFDYRLLQQAVFEKDGTLLIVPGLKHGDTDVWVGQHLRNAILNQR